MSDEEEGRRLALVATISYLLRSAGADLDEFEAFIASFIARMPSSEDPAQDLGLQATRRAAAAELTLFLEAAREPTAPAKRSPGH